MITLRRLGVLALIGTATISCSNANQSPVMPQQGPKTTRPIAPDPNIPIPLQASVLATTHEDLGGIFFTRRGTEALLIYFDQNQWNGKVVGENNKPKQNSPFVIAPSSSEVKFITSSKANYAVTLVRSEGANHRLELVEVDSNGNIQPNPTLVSMVPHEIRWVEAVATSKGWLVFWEAEDTNTSSSQLFAASILQGKGVGKIVEVAKNATWQITPTDDGAAVVLTAESSTPKKNASAEQLSSDFRNDVSVALIDATGTLKNTVPITNSKSARDDAQIVYSNGKIVLAWTDTKDIESHVYSATMDTHGTVLSKPHAVTPPAYEHALVSLVNAPNGTSSPVTIAWEEFSFQNDARQIRVAPIDLNGVIGKDIATVVFHAEGFPDFASSEDGLAALSVFPAMLNNKKHPPNLWPAFIRLNSSMNVIASEPIQTKLFESTDGVPDLVQDLSCSGKTCTAIAIGGSTIALVELPVRTSPWVPAAFHNVEESKPRVKQTISVHRGDQLSKLASVQLNDETTLASWVTYHLEDLRSDSSNDSSASLWVSKIANTGSASTPILISKKASSVGGVSMAKADGAKSSEAMIGWVAIEKGESQVYATKIDNTGKKIAQKKLTSASRRKNDGKRSEASDVAVRYISSTSNSTKGTSAGGWLFLWADSRNGQFDIYGAKVEQSLTRIGTDRRFTNLPGDVADIDFVLRGDDGYVVWSHVAPNDQQGDIYFAHFNAKTLELVGHEQKVFSSAADSHSPHLSFLQNDIVLTWIEGEESTDKLDHATQGLYVSRIDESGHLLGNPQRYGTPNGSVFGATVGCATLCRAVLSVSAENNAVTLFATELDLFKSNTNMKPLLSYGTLIGVAPTMSNAHANEIYFADHSEGQSGKVRRMTIEWP